MSKNLRKTQYFSTCKNNIYNLPYSEKYSHSITEYDSANNKVITTYYSNWNSSHNEVVEVQL